MLQNVETQYLGKARVAKGQPRDVLVAKPTRIDLATADALRPEMRDEILSEAVRAF